MVTYFTSFWQQVNMQLGFALHPYYCYLLFILGARGFDYSLKLFFNQNLINHHKTQCSSGEKKKKKKRSERGILD